MCSTKVKIFAKVQMVFIPNFEKRSLCEKKMKIPKNESFVFKIYIIHLNII